MKECKEYTNRDPRSQKKLYSKSTFGKKSDKKWSVEGCIFVRDTFQRHIPGLKRVK